MARARAKAKPIGAKEAGEKECSKEVGAKETAGKEKGKARRACTDLMRERGVNGAHRLPRPHPRAFPSTLGPQGPIIIGGHAFP